MGSPSLSRLPRANRAVFVALGLVIACGSKRPPPAAEIPPPPDEDSELALEHYISVYPDDPVYTPDAMLRLADLRAQKALTGCLRANRRPCRALRPALYVAQRLLRDFPDSALADDAVLRVAKWHLEEGSVDRAMSALFFLVCEDLTRGPLSGAPQRPPADENALDQCTPHWPNSDVLPVAWGLTADQFFIGWTGQSALVQTDPARRRIEPGNVSLAWAEAAYLQALKLMKDATEKRKVSLRIVWTHYLRGRFTDAFEAAVEFLRHDETREEARLIALRSAVNLDWDGDGRRDAKIGVDRPQVLRFLETHRPGAPELLRDLAHGLRQRGERKAADRATGVFLSWFPDHPDAATLRPGRSR